MTPQQIELALETIALVLEDLKKTQEKQQATITAIKEALAEHAMREVQRLGQEIEPDDIASILACRDMLDAQPVPPRTWVGLTDDEKNDCLVSADPCEALAEPEARQLIEDVEQALKERNQ